MQPSVAPDDRLTAFGNQLVEIHLWLREELARLREDAGAHLTRPDLRDLRTHCLTFCSALSRHHSGEDGGAFRVLADQFPELRPVLARLVDDHRMVAAILRRLEELLAEPDAPALRTELDGLAALLESHFTYEERKLVAALNALSPGTGTTEELLGA